MIDPIAAMIAALPQREHVPRWYAGPQGEDWKPGRGPYRPREARREPKPLYTVEWYEWHDSMSLLPAAYRAHLSVIR